MNVGGQYIFRIRPGHWLDRIQLNANYTGAGRIYWTEKNTVSQTFYGTLNGRISFQKGHGQIDFWVQMHWTKSMLRSIFGEYGERIYAERTACAGGNRVGCRF